tara:strand:- start:1111 stop:1596 length:486 start_codon:yes stop_codon:yes gene_type:complete
MSQILETPIDSINIDQWLEEEKTFNKTEPWSKLNKTSKIQKLHSFAEKYGNRNKLSAKEVKELKHYFSEILSTRLNKTKDVIYDKDQQEITDIPGLCRAPNTKSFTIRVDTSKRQSTLKSLTPKRTTERNRSNKHTSIIASTKSSTTDTSTDTNVVETLND